MLYLSVESTVIFCKAKKTVEILGPVSGGEIGIYYYKSMKPAGDPTNVTG